MPALELAGLRITAVVGESAADGLVLINRDPVPGEADVPQDSPVALELVDLGPRSVDQASVRVFIDDVLAYDGAAPRAVQPGFDGPRHATTEKADSFRLVLDPVVGFASQATVSVRVQASAHDRSVVFDETYSFTVEDRTAPRLIAAQAISSRCVRIAFDEPIIEPLALESISFGALDAPAMPIAPIGFEATSTLLRVDLDTEMTPDVRYQVRAQGITDRNGNIVTAPFEQVIFAGFRPQRPAARHLDLWSMLPKYNRRADVTGDLRAFIACLQEVLELLLAAVDRFPDAFDIERAPEPFVDAILLDLGNPFPFALDGLQKRRLASVLVDMYRQKGTAPGIRNAIRFFVGIEHVDVVPFSDTALVLGTSALGVDWELGTDDRFARYAFNVRVGRMLSASERQIVRAIIDYMRPANTHFAKMLEPTLPEEPLHWELSVSELSVSSLLH